MSKRTGRYSTCLHINKKNLIRHKIGKGRRRFLDFLRSHDPVILVTRLLENLKLISLYVTDDANAKLSNCKEIFIIFPQTCLSSLILSRYLKLCKGK